MRGFNRAIIAGNLTRDPEVRQTINKRSLARFGVAVNNNYKDNNGELKESTEYINVVVWGPMAENCGKYLKKGRPVLVEGRIQTSVYEAKDGSGKRYSTEINASNVVFLGQVQGQQGSNNDFSSQPWPDENEPPDIPFGYTDSNFGSSISESGFGENSAGKAENAEPANESDIPF